MMKTARPINLDLLTFHFPLTAITSILHRVSGVVIFIGLPFILWAFDASLASNSSFLELIRISQSLPVKLLLLLYLAALLYHLVAGIKHLCMDMGFAETKSAAQLASVLTLLVTFALVVGFGVWMW